MLAIYLYSMDFRSYKFGKDHKGIFYILHHFMERILFNTFGQKAAACYSIQVHIPKYISTSDTKAFLRLKCAKEKLCYLLSLIEINKLMLMSYYGRLMSSDCPSG